MNSLREELFPFTDQVLRKICSSVRSCSLKVSTKGRCQVTTDTSKNLHKRDMVKQTAFTCCLGGNKHRGRFLSHKFALKYVSQFLSTPRSVISNTIQLQEPFENYLGQEGVFKNWICTLIRPPEMNFQVSPTFRTTDCFHYITFLIMTKRKFNGWHATKNWKLLKWLSGEYFLSSNRAAFFLFLFLLVLPERSIIINKNSPYLVYTTRFS